MIVAAVRPAGRTPAAQRIGRGVNVAVTHVPWTWRFLRRPMTRFFDRVAPRWDERFANNPDRLVPLAAALDLIPAAPARVLDVGTGTGMGAFMLAQRWPEADVTGIDVAPQMIAQAGDKSGGDRVRFLVADVATLDPGAGYDLVVLLNMHPFFKQVARLLRAGGHVVAVSSRGAATPFYTPPATLARGFERHGLVTVATDTAGPGTYYLARRP